jgi:hypothetical protein
MGDCGIAARATPLHLELPSGLIAPTIGCSTSSLASYMSTSPAAIQKLGACVDVAIG